MRQVPHAPRRAPASMGPQLDSCGREAYREAVGELAALQWGRNLIVAEGLMSDEAARSAMQLQWGRNLIVAEGQIMGSTSSAFDWLQWGRNLIVAEGARMDRAIERAIRFNGAAT